MKPGKGKPGRAKMLLVVLVLMGQREGLDLGLESMGPAIDHEDLDTGLALPSSNSGFTCPDPYSIVAGSRAERYATYGTAPATYASVYYSDAFFASRSRSFSLSRTGRDVAGQGGERPGKIPKPGGA